MITAVEINGFKAFDHFHTELRPFQVLIGANGVGKSNLFTRLCCSAILPMTTRCMRRFSAADAG